jgi:hypothetical protein
MDNPTRCFHCGAILVDRGKIIRKKFVNGWTGASECRDPRCPEGDAWYDLHTEMVNGYRCLKT